MRTFVQSILAAALFLPAAAQAGEWQLDPAHSRVGFRVAHMMVTYVEGGFDEVSATLDYEVGKLDDLSVEVTVDVASVDTDNDKRDEHLRASDFLDVANHPNMTFVSTGVKPLKNGRFELTGDLTLRGVTKPVTLTATGLDSAVRDPWGNLRVGASATGVIDRQDFGVSYSQLLETGGLAVGNEVELRIDVVFTQPAS
jgi:polyisoprenoid-binding protein YceI